MQEPSRSSFDFLFGGVERRRFIGGWASVSRANVHSKNKDDYSTNSGYRQNLNVGYNIAVAEGKSYIKEKSRPDVDNDKCSQMLICRAQPKTTGEWLKPVLQNLLSFLQINLMNFNKKILPRPISVCSWCTFPGCNSTLGNTWPNRNHIAPFLR